MKQQILGARRVGKRNEPGGGCQRLLGASWALSVYDDVALHSLVALARRSKFASLTVLGGQERALPSY